MLIEVLQLRLQELHEWDDGLQREERGRSEGRGVYPAGHSRPGRILEGLLPTEHGQAVPAVVLLLIGASSEACGGLGPITDVSSGVGREQ